MRLHGKIESSYANGPGNRAVIWFQGCTLKCSGCHNPESHSFDVEETEITQICAWIRSLRDIEGITFSGGEPLQHYNDFAHLCRFIRLVRPELSIGLFTGYTLRELETGSFLYRVRSHFAQGSQSAWFEVKELIDFAIMGRYNRQKSTNDLPLCGSSNQSIELFSSRYSSADFAQQSFEITITEDLVQITGFPGLEFLKSIE